MKPLTYCKRRKCIHLQRDRCALKGNVVDEFQVEQCKANRYFREDAPNPNEKIGSSVPLFDLLVGHITKF